MARRAVARIPFLTSEIGHWEVGKERMYGDCVRTFAHIFAKATLTEEANG